MLLMLTEQPQWLQARCPLSNLVRDPADALEVSHALREENASFCALALEYSKGKQSKEKMVVLLVFALFQN